MAMFVALMPTYYITMLIVKNKKQPFICKQPAKHNMITDSETSDRVWKTYFGKSDGYVFTSLTSYIISNCLQESNRFNLKHENFHTGFKSSFG